jgi:dTDP-4-amino-4,6-dideoxygalactose transaminase
MIPLAEPNLGGRELEYLQECIATNFVSSVGAFVDRFERDFAAFVGSPHAVAAANGTSALHIALVLAGVGPGDEVWVSDFTFAASANPIKYQHATPVLVDSERRTWNMDPALVAEELDRRAKAGLKQPKAIMAVHILGIPADLAPIAEACERHGVCLIEDAAEALGATYTDGPYAGRQVGTLGRMGCFSFNGNKIMTTGGGGMLVTSDPELARHAKHLTTQAKKPGYAYFHTEVGYNYRLTNLAAAMGVAQLEQLPAFLARKRAIAARYSEAFKNLPGLTLPPAPAGMAPSSWLYSILLPGPWEPVLKGLEAEGIQTRPLWTALHLMPPYADCPRVGSGDVAADLCARGLSLPCSTNLKPEQQDAVIAAVRGLLEKSA